MGTTEEDEEGITGALRTMPLREGLSQFIDEHTSTRPDAVRRRA